MRRLTLAKETLTELSTDALSDIVGGITTIQLYSLQFCPDTPTAPTLPVIYCVTNA